MTETRATVIATERQWSEGIYDVRIRRETGGRPVNVLASSVTAEDAWSIASQVAALDPADLNYRARCYIIATAKGGEFVIAYKGGSHGGSGTIHRTSCGQLVRKANAMNAGRMFDVDITQVVSRAREWRTQNPNTCGICAKGVVLS